MTQEQAIEKIKKLLRLGRSPNRNEAMAAIAKAHEIAAATGIAIDGIDPDSEHARITHERGEIRRRSHARGLCHIMLKRHFGVRVFGSSAGCMYVGPDVNIQIAKHVEEFLVRFACSEWREWAAREYVGSRRKPSAARRRSFEAAFFSVVDRVLLSNPIRNDAAQLKYEIEKYVQRNFCVSSTTLPNYTHGRYASDFVAGANAGLKVNLSRPVENGAAAKMIGT